MGNHGLDLLYTTTGAISMGVRDSPVSVAGDGALSTYHTATATPTTTPATTKAIADYEPLFSAATALNTLASTNSKGVWRP